MRWNHPDNQIELVGKLILLSIRGYDIYGIVIGVSYPNTDWHLTEELVPSFKINDTTSFERAKHSSTQAMNEPFKLHMYFETSPKKFYRDKFRIQCSCELDLKFVYPEYELLIFKIRHNL